MNATIKALLASYQMQARCPDVQHRTDRRDELVARLDGVPAAVTAAVTAKSAALADQLLGLARQKAGGGVLQSRTGALAGSIKVDGVVVTGGRVTATVSAGSDLKYAAIQ